MMMLELVGVGALGWWDGDGLGLHIMEENCNFSL